ncbi:hypothetical protein [Desulfohalobium retbaense]|uniref:Lipoprotein n=1 Tax=Desulfohalobium retbaense (strain ATCC 49708 / DSM 5692 / JCM 16813 / HR100) TaxID=485915 RepID=C8X174_DESRD|nr:hypothetical protein [Desulfohalobium retbaense]ACV68171.1 hypothetical protein Dret_0880 [Desulfohalobium retbaense DSM 5692]
MTHKTSAGLTALVLGVLLLFGCATQQEEGQANATTETRRLEREVSELHKTNRRLEQKIAELEDQLEACRQHEPDWETLQKDLQTLLDKEANATRRKAEEWLEDWEEKLESWRQRVAPSPPEEGQRL